MLKENSLCQIPGPVTDFTPLLLEERYWLHVYCAAQQQMYVQALGFEDSLLLCVAYSQFKNVGVKLLIHCSQLVFVADKQYLSFFFSFSLFLFLIVFILLW